MSKCLWSRWKWQRRVKEITSSFPCCPVYCEYSWNKTQIEKKQQRPWLYPCKLNMPYQNYAEFKLKYSWFKNMKIWLTESFFDNAKLKIYSLARFWNLYLHAKNQVDSSILIYDIADSDILQSDCSWPHQIKFFEKSALTFLQSISACQKSSWLTLLAFR